MLSLLPLAGTIAATFLWLSAPQATQKERVNMPVNPANKIAAPAPTIVQKEKKPASMPRQSVQQTLSKVHSKDKTGSPNALNIQGITAIELAKSELGGLGITVNNDCGISVDNGMMIGTFYNTNIPALKEGSKQSDDKDSYLNQSFTRWNLTTSKTSVQHKSYPLLVTSIQGVILSDGLGNRVEDQVVSTEIQKSIDSIAAHNPNNKSTVAFFLYPNDSSMTDEDFQRRYLSLRNLNTKDSSLTMENVRKIVGDTADHSVVFKRLTQADVDKMERDKKLRAEKINEYLRLNKLIAIRVNADCPNSSLILWYEPNEDFIYNLTERYRADLQKEMLGKERAQKQDTTYWVLEAVEPQEKPQTGCQFTDICRATSGAVLESSVFPNPASEKISLTFRLNADRRCTFSLHDLNGIYIKDLGTDMQYLKGEQTFTAPLGDTGAGVYLLSMHTDKDERIVQRVIIKK